MSQDDYTARIETEKERLKKIEEAYQNLSQVLNGLSKLRETTENYIRTLETVDMHKKEFDIALDKFGKYVENSYGESSASYKTGRESSVMQAYKTTIFEEFDNTDVFSEQNIRLLVTGKGLLVKGQPINKEYSFYIMKHLVRDGFLRKLGRGKYQLVSTVMNTFLDNPDGQNKEGEITDSDGNVIEDDDSEDVLEEHIMTELEEEIYEEDLLIFPE